MTAEFARYRTALFALLAVAMLVLGPAACSLPEGKMPQSYPDDVDGQVLQNIADAGSDMSKPMLIDFQISVPDEASAVAIAEAAAKLGYRTKTYRHEIDDPWTTECSKEMLATYDGVISAQAELDALSKPFGGYSDGWGTFGNFDAPTKPNPAD